MRGVEAGIEITELVLFSSAITLQIPLLMAILSLILPMSVVRYMSAGLSLLLMAVVIVSHPYSDLDDVLFMLMELIALVLIVVVVKIIPVLTWAPVVDGKRNH